MKRRNQKSFDCEMSIASSTIEVSMRMFGSPGIPVPASPQKISIFVATVACVAMAISGCNKGEHLPDPNSKAYTDLVSNFYVGLAALQVGDDVRAESTLSQATQIAPGEPAAWANW